MGRLKKEDKFLIYHALILMAEGRGYSEETEDKLFELADRFIDFDQDQHKKFCDKFLK
jgi:hypothetical protein